MSDLFQHIFQLPAHCMFHTIMPKNAFGKKNNLSAPEKKLIETPHVPLKSILKASLVQNRSHIPPYIGEDMDYQDILFFHIQLEPNHLNVYANKLIDLYQKYIPKPCIILLQSDTQIILNTALKKYNEADANKRVIVEQLTTPVIDLLNQEEQIKSFIQALSFEHITKQNLITAHQSYASAITNYNIAHITGDYGDTKDVSENAEKIRKIKALESEMDTLRNKIKKSKDIREKIDFNLLLKEKRTNLQTLKNSL